ncbi:MAG: AraC family transcriptional regulator [Ruminococcaceae bacterium]|nr:AraC family transcriptional regulator [Oscillospiraceae bacterium]
MSKLCKKKPLIGEFYQAVEGVIHKRFLPEKPHGRESDAFIYITEGKCVYRFADETFSAQSGDILFLARGGIYSMDIQSEEYRFIFIDFDFASDAPCKHEVFKMQNARATESMFRRMLEKWRQKRLGVKEECLSLLYSVYAEVIKSEGAEYLPNSKRAKLENALHFIAENFSKEDLTVENVAQIAGMSQSHFRRLFKSAYRISPIKYINIMRIDRAKELIRYTNESFSDIAAEVGFANLYYFSRIFKKEVGCTPSEFKEEYSEYQKM